MTSRERLRATFDDVAELYDRARPTYPKAVFDDLAALGGLEPGSRVVEIGCGTGQATVPLAARGFDVTCVELGERLAAFARAKLARFPNVRVVTADFESWEPERADFDAIVAFTAFHWLDPQTRYASCTRLLRPGGALGIVEAHHVLPPDGDSFFAEVQEDYDAVVPSEDNRPPGPPEEIGDEIVAEIAASGHFAAPIVRGHLWEVVYTADAYIAVLDTYSGHRALDPSPRRRLYERIRSRIAQRPDGVVRKTYLATVNVSGTLTAGARSAAAATRAR